MRVALVMWPTPAHLYPMVPLAWALRTAGHEVCIVSHPSIGETVSRQGLPFRQLCAADAMPLPIGPGGAWAEGRADVGRVTAEIGVPPEEIGTWITFSQFLLPCMWDFLPYRGGGDAPMPAMDGLVEFFRGWRPQLVVWDPVMPGAAVAARVVGARHCRFSGPDYVGSSLDTFTRLTAAPERASITNPLVETVRPMARKYGVPLDRETLYGQWTIDPMPPAFSLGASTRTIPVQWIPHVSEEPMPDWLHAASDRPRIAVTLGVSTREYIKADWSHVALLFEAVSELDVEVVATLDRTQLADVPKIPDNVRVLEFFPLDQLLPTCSAVIHHGGFGSLFAACRARIPQIVVDFLELPVGASANEDGTVTGSRYPLAPAVGGFVTGHGAGEVMDLSRPTVEGIRDQIRRVAADPVLRAGTRRLYEDLVISPSPHGIVPILEELARPA